MCRVAWWLIAPWVVSLMVSGAKGETTRSDTGAVVLTAEERAWLQAHAPLRYAPDPAFPPFEFIDQDGQVRGITPELLDLISRRLGVEIAYVRYPTWSEVLAGIRRGEVDLLGTLTRTTEREAFLDFTRPYLEVPIVLFVPKKSTVKGFTDLYNRRVGVVQDYGANPWLKTQHPMINVVPVVNSREGFLKLALGELDAMFEVLAVGEYIIANLSLTDIRVVPRLDLVLPQHLAVAKGNTNLLAILDKGLASLTEAEKRRVFKNWVTDESLLAMSRWAVTGKRVALGVTLALIALGAWTLALRCRLSRREREIRASLEREATLERRYRDVIENTADLVYLIDLEGNFIFFNPAAERLLGYTREEASKLNITHVVAPEHMQNVRQQMAKKLETGAATVFEVEVITKGGERRWLEVSSKLTYENGRPVGIQGVARDITDRKQVEQQLRHSEMLYYSLIENIPMGVFRKDSQGRFTFVNDWFCKFIGLPRDQIIGKTDFDLFPKELAELYRQDDLRVMKSAQVSDAERVCPRADQQNRWLRIVRTPLKDDSGGVAIQGIFWDITDRWSVREFLKESVSLLRATLESTHDGILVVDKNRRISHYNRRFLEMWKIPEEVIARRDSRALAEYVAPQLKDPEGFIAGLNRLYENLELHCEDTVEFKDGRVFERFSHPQRVGDKIVGRVWSFHDITAAKQAEDRRRRAEEQLRQSQKLEAIGRLAAGVAHDFNNILTAIIGNAYLLEPAVSDDGLAQEYLQQIITNAERASKLIKQLMIFSRTHALNCEPLDFNEVLCGMIEMLRRLIGENIDLRVNCTPGPQTVMADRSAMEQLILNLVINARDAMPHGGILTLSASAVELDQSAATQRGLTKPGRYLCFSVEDTGVGMDKAVQERIFDPFFTTKETGKGTGLGLSTVHGIVQQHGGAIEVESAPGRGSKFTVFFPTLPGKAPARNESVQNIATRGQGELVMVVEDDPAVRRMVETALGKLGYSVISATSGLEAIELWPKYRDKVRVLMTDIVMPGGIDGVEVAARFRKDNPSLGIVLTSGYSSELAEGCAALPEGCKFLAKPYQMAHLADVIQASLK